MKTQLSSLAAGVLLSAFAISTAFAGTVSDTWIVDARAVLQARVAAAGLADDGKAVTIRIKATDDNKRYAPAVARSSGSADFDNAVREALDGVKLPRPPIELNGRGVTFTLGETAGDSTTGGH